jgi:hypothetical protein
MKRKLTQKEVERLTPADGQVVWDSALPGFGVTTRGGNAYVVQYRNAAGKSRRSG